jgi:hypothetical protein
MSLWRYGFGENLHMNVNWCLKVMIPPEGPESSEAFMPNTLDMKDNGKKMIVTTVNNMMERPCARAASASTRLACCCLSPRRPSNCSNTSVSLFPLAWGFEGEG